jgi:hypothetical protein
VLTTSDEWFAESHNLLTAAAPISRKGHFTPKGAWFDGWETRRHGPEFDWYVCSFIIFNFTPPQFGSLIYMQCNAWQERDTHIVLSLRYTSTHDIGA